MKPFSCAHTVTLLCLYTSTSLAFDGTVLVQHARSRWSNNTAMMQDAQQPSDTLLAFTAANVGHRTSAFLASLAATRDSFDLLAVDEHSSDNTANDLALHGVHTILINESVGVTALWNKAYQYYLQHGYDKLIYSNNDVLVPSGVIDKLRQALDEGCDLISPLSTIKGKGHMGREEGIEVLYNLSEQAADAVNNPGNYYLVQHLLDVLYRDRTPEAVWKGRNHFNGFFFALSSRIKAAAYAEDLLFDPNNFNLDQETDLLLRMGQKKMTLCVHKGAFVYHFKGATIPVYTADRRAWRRENL